MNKMVSTLNDLVIAASVVGTLFVASSAQAASLASDDFETPTAPAGLDGASGGSGWTGNWNATGGANIVSKSLSPPIGPSGPGGSLQAVLINANSSNVMDRSFGPFSSGPLYVGFTVRGENLDTDNFISVQASDGATSNGADTLSVGFRNQSGNPFYARVGDSSASGDTVNASQNLTDSTDFRVIAKFSKNALEYEITELFINPADLTEPVTPDAVANSTQPDITQLSLITVRSVGFGDDDALFIDNLIVADNFADAVGRAVPEPASVCLWVMLGAVVGGVAFRQRRR